MRGLDGHHCHTQGSKVMRLRLSLGGTGLGRGRALLGPGVGPATVPPASQDEANPLPVRAVLLAPLKGPAEPLVREPAQQALAGTGPASSSTFHILFPPRQTRTENKQTKENAVSFLAVRLLKLAPREEVWLKRPSLEQLIPRLSREKHENKAWSSKSD